ncbi:hypothetical protein GTZ89_06260 [Streptomyces sp. SID8382]|uniref:hypothetical protein n=1 Tax=Streptomyces malaysiensis TaxID=92644 RepID=UPI000C2BBEB4|nr:MULTISPECIES: hypothetical protein [unclassified Streptomyces]AUA11673.1 hypothetical protein CFP59_03788 [Streptomyces sp. M56]MYX55337.1 hypothetical protein [Streptomyces sp. SID8382]
MRSIYARNLTRYTTVAAALGIFLGVTNSAGASERVAAEYGCTGSLIDTYPVRASTGATYGNIRLYYNSATGRNCAVNVKTSLGGYGKASHVSVTLKRCKTSTPGAWCNTSGEPWRQDWGNYTYYAGPVELSAAGRCIHVVGAVNDSPPHADGSSGSNGVHCG